MNNKEIQLCDAIDVIEEILASGGEFRMYPKGISMLPLLVQGEDSVVLQKKNPALIKKYDIVFYRRKNGQIILHRVLKVCKNNTYVICGDNQTVLEKNVQPDQIIGYVSKIYKGDQLLSYTSMPYRIYMRVWMWLPYRRVVLFFKRGFRFIKKCIKK